MARENILIISPDTVFLEDLSGVLEQRGYGAFTAWNLEVARMIIERERVHIVICGAPALRKQGGEFLEWVSVREPGIVTVVLSEWADWEAAMRGLERALRFDKKDGAAAEPSEVRAEPPLFPNRIVDELEKNYPGISKLRTDPDGFLIL